jgi:CheY-like chemotaxis protein
MQNTLHPLILIVDDNKDILFHLQLILEENNYIVKTAKNGEVALRLLSTLKTPPDLIISDIMMPGMNGYDFFTTVSNSPHWNRIPFLFLTAKSTPEDIRLGKLLGVDDYITKPFKNEDLLASISGKITRNKHSNLIDEKIKKILSTLNIRPQTSISNKDQPFLCLITVYWNDTTGPTVKKTYPLEKNLPLSINNIGKQLFHAATSIYGHDKITNAQGILIDIENIKNKGYLFFDSFPDSSERYGEKQYMISVNTPNLSYLDSIRIKEIMKEISANIKKRQDWDIKKYWFRILEVISTESVLLHT